MTVATIKNYFLRAGASFRDSDFWRQHHITSTGTSRVLRSGRFGIGALAVFLLGDTMIVRTRNCGEPEGIEFRASLADKILELRPFQCEVGTTISVRVSKDTAEHLAQHEDEWDWYVLAVPRVVRRVEGRELDQEYLYEGPGEALPAGAWRVAAAGFSDIQWRFGQSYRAPSVVCNGIRIDGPRYGWRYDAAPAVHSLLHNPQVSVFDSDANLPLNLQRSIVSKWPFRVELCDSIARDIVAYVIVNGSGADPTKLIDAPHPGMAPVLGDDAKLSWLSCCPTGWTITAKAPEWISDCDRVVIASSVVAADCVDLTKCIFAVLEENDSSEAYSQGVPFAEWIPLLGGEWFGRTVNAGAAFVVFDDDKRVDGFKYIQSRSAKYYLQESIFERKWGRSFKPTFNVRRAKKLMQRGHLIGIAEIVFGASTRGEAAMVAGFTKSWLKYTETGVVPYDERKRSKLASRKELRPHIEYYRHLAERDGD
jgi:hypothetical protein